MGALELKDKLIKQFQIFIQDESKLVALDGVFDAMTTNPTDIESDSLVPDEHYKIVEARREKRLNGKTEGKIWDHVSEELKKKYGL